MLFLKKALRMTNNRPPPLVDFDANLLNSIEAVAPEKAAELCEIIQQNNIRFVIDSDSVKILFKSTPSNSTITFGLRALELLWGRAFAYCSLYEYITSKLLNGEDVTDLDLTHPEIKPAMDLLSWVITTEIQIRNGEIDSFTWPAGFPRPFNTNNAEAFENAADELMLVTLAAILHHEIGHITRNHTPETLEYVAPEVLTPESRETFLRWEREADRWSAEWLLDGLETCDDRFLKRVLGLTLAYLWIASRNIHTGNWLTYHPPAWDRIYQNVKQHVPNDDTHPIWSFIAYVMLLHLTSVGTPLEISEVETPEDLVNEILDFISELH